MSKEKSSNLTAKIKQQRKGVKIAAIVVAAIVVFGITYAFMSAVRGMASHPPQMVLEQRQAKEEAQYRADKEKALERQRESEPENKSKKEDQAGKSAEAEIKALAGKTVAEAENEASALGYTIACLDANTELDMTADIKALGVEGDWTVTKVGKIDASKKTATLYVLSSETAEENREAESVKDALTDKLSPSYAWGAVEMYGLSQYPYGFKRKSMLAEEPHDENTWFLKGTCEIKNEYGTKMKNLTFEALVTGTSDNPQVIEFSVY